MAARPAPRPEWALAYILEDWRRQRAVKKAYDAACEEREDAEYLRSEALRKLRAYVAALESVGSQ